MSQPYRYGFWFNMLGIVILATGMAGAIYVDKTPPSQVDAIEYRIVNNHAFAVQSEDSKQHVGELQMYGGNTAVIIATFNRKLTSLVHGKNLVYMLVTTSLILAAGCFLLAWLLRERD